MSAIHSGGPALSAEHYAIAEALTKRIVRTIFDPREPDVTIEILHVSLLAVLLSTFKVLMVDDTQRIIFLHAFVSMLENRVSQMMQTPTTETRQ